MTDNNQPVSPLRQRMIEDMRLRKLGPRTQSAYIRALKKFTRFLGRSPDAADAEDLRRFLLRLASTGVSHATINGTLTGLRFFFEMTLHRPEAMKWTGRVHPLRKLPVVLSIEEVTRLLVHARGLKYQVAVPRHYLFAVPARPVGDRRAMGGLD